jgi:hypothetical protein
LSQAAHDWNCRLLVFDCRFLRRRTLHHSGHRKTPQGKDHRSARSGVTRYALREASNFAALS